MDIASLPGFREFSPADLHLRRHILSTWRDVARRYGFVEYDGPPLEPLELYTRKSGPEIVEQLYAFTDRGEREVALRPEMTPTFARMVSAHAGALPKPIKWFSVPQLFRYERPQRGRLREHFQLNVDVVGEPGPVADAEVIAAAVDVLRALGLGPADVVARVSDRGLISGILERLGVPAQGRPSALAAIDRLQREPESRTLGRLRDAGAGDDAARRILALGGRALDDLVEEFGGEDLGESADRLTQCFDCLEAFGLGEFVEFDARLVRGLAYYTGIVFEVWERGGELRAICGGGRYDGLLAALGGTDLPAAGFGMGDVVLGELLRDRDLVPEPEPAIEDFVVYVTEEQRPLALRTVHALRDGGRRTGFDYAGRGAGRQFKAADRLGARRAIVLGPEEEAAGVALVRDMESGAERRVPLAELLGAGAGSAPALAADSKRP